MSVEEPVAPVRPQRRVVLVCGSGRSGTSTLAGILRTLGMTVPAPEVPADETNPRGFGESQWVVDFHTELLARANVQVSDTRPSAWYDAGRVGDYDPLRTRLATWLETQLADVTERLAASDLLASDAEIVVKDPRLAWFLGLWRGAALRCDATPSYVTMLRPVTEVVGSKQRYYAGGGGAGGGAGGAVGGAAGAGRAGEVQRTAAWVSMMLHTERATRGSLRRFVRYADVVEDWTVPVFDLGRAFDLEAVVGAQANAIRAVHDFVDPGLRRVRSTWEDLDVPADLRELAEETSTQLDRLADPGGDVPAVHGELDRLRTAYADLYESAEALTGSTALAARREGRAEARGQVRGDGGFPPPRPAAPGPGSGGPALAGPGAASRPGVRRPPAPGASPTRSEPAAPVAGRGLDRVPRRLRALVPPRARRALRRVLDRPRPDSSPDSRAEPPTGTGA